MKISELLKSITIFLLYLPYVHSDSVTSETIDIDISKLLQERCLIEEWKQKPVAVCRRTKEQIEVLKSFDATKLGDPNGKEIIKSIMKLSAFTDSAEASHIFAAQNELEGTKTRSLNDEYFIAILVSPYDGCSPTFRPDIGPGDLGKDWKGGFFNPCSGEGYDMAGRVLSGHGLGNNWNLRIPPHKYLSPGLVRIGVMPDSVDAKHYDFSPNFYSRFYYIEQRLILASLWGDDEAISNILDKGIDPNKVNVGGFYPLHMAVLGNRDSSVMLLLEKGAKLDIKTSAGNTP